MRGPLGSRPGRPKTVTSNTRPWLPTKGSPSGASSNQALDRVPPPHGTPCSCMKFLEKGPAAFLMFRDFLLQYRRQSSYLAYCEGRDCNSQGEPFDVAVKLTGEKECCRRFFPEIVETERRNGGSRPPAKSAGKKRRGWWLDVPRSARRAAARHPHRPNLAVQPDRCRLGVQGGTRRTLGAGNGDCPPAGRECNAEEGAFGPWAAGTRCAGSVRRKARRAGAQACRAMRTSTRRFRFLRRSGAVWSRWGGACRRTSKGKIEGLLSAANNIKTRRQRYLGG